MSKGVGSSYVSFHYIFPHFSACCGRSSQAREVWISKFEKPKTSPNSIDPSTTALSMYISHGCLSTRKFWHALCEVYSKRGGSKPPVSLKVMEEKPHLCVVGGRQNSFGVLLLKPRQFEFSIVGEKSGPRTVMVSNVAGFWCLQAVVCDNGATLLRKTQPYRWAFEYAPCP